MDIVYWKNATTVKAIKKFQRKAELHEWNVEAMEEEEHNKQVWKFIFVIFYSVQKGRGQATF